MLGRHHGHIVSDSSLITCMCTHIYTSALYMHVYKYIIFKFIPNPALIFIHDLKLSRVNSTLHSKVMIIY